MPRLTEWVSPSLVVSSIALLVSLGGVGYAATQLPPNSVGSKQLAANAVTSPKVKNGSLRKVDFGPGQLPGGPAGPAGPAGPTGPAGARGMKGNIGPSDGYEDFAGGPVMLRTVMTRVATLRLPQAGKYVIWSKAMIRHTAQLKPLATCELVSAHDGDSTSASAPDALGRSFVTNILVEEISEPTSVNLNCLAVSESTAFNARIVAIRVGTLTRTTG